MYAVKIVEDTWYDLLAIEDEAMYAVWSFYFYFILVYC